MARSAWSKPRSSAIWRTSPEQTASAAGGAGDFAALARQAEALGWELEPAVDGLEDLGRPAPGQVPPVDPAGATQFIGIVRRALRYGQEPEVGQHGTPGPVRGGCRALAPRRHLLGHPSGAPRHAADVAEPPPRLLGVSRRGAIAQDLVALVEGPLEPAHVLQPLREDGVELQEVGDIAHGVLELALRHRALHPIGQAVGLGQCHVEHRLDEAGQRR